MRTGLPTLRRAHATLCAGLRVERPLCGSSGGGIPPRALDSACVDERKPKESVEDLKLADAALGARLDQLEAAATDPASDKDATRAELVAVERELWHVTRKLDRLEGGRG